MTDVKPMQRYIIDRYDEIIDKPEVRQYYEDTDYLNFGLWEEETRNQKQACENLMERLLSFIPEKAGSILDVACGKGETTAYLQKYFSPDDITGINISAKQLDVAKKNAPKCTFIQMDATELQFPDNTFDVVISVEAAFHFNTRELFLKEALRVLKPGGMLVLSDILMTLDSEIENKARTEKNYLSNLDHYNQVLKYVGFENVDVIDVTEECWKRHFMHAVNYLHRKFLDHELDQHQLESNLSRSYGRAKEIVFYLLAAACKP